MARWSAQRRLTVYYSAYTVAFLVFVYMMALAEHKHGVGIWLGYVFLFVTVAIYASIGLICRTADLGEYYVAGRKVPAVFNGMATAADWMSAATFIGLAGTLFMSGYDALAYMMGWTGGFCLVAFMIAPYLRKLGGYTIPDFLAVRYGRGAPGGSRLVRGIAVVAAVLCSFVYLIAQIQGVGLIVTRFIGVEFAVGVFFGLAGVLVCSFLGGMRAVTWTQVAQYIILIIAFLLPVSMIAIKGGHGPLPQLNYGELLTRIDDREKQLATSEREIEVHQHFRQRARMLQGKIDRLPHSFDEERQALLQELRSTRQRNAPLRELKLIERKVSAFPADAAAAYIAWSQQRDDAKARSDARPPTLEPFPQQSGEDIGKQRLNFILLVFCLMMGTASLPHILTRFCTTPSVAETRSSVAWTLFFIALLYLTAPALAALIKHAILSDVIGSTYTELPTWIMQWRKLDPPLLLLQDVNNDGIVQLGELVIRPDMVMLAAPEIAGLPYVISGLVAAGALAAALSTADGLLLTIATALSHDVYYHMLDPTASNQKRVTAAKLVLLGVALFASYVTSLQPGNILFLVGTAFSLAASSFFPALVLGIFWKRTTRVGAIAGMLTGLSVCSFYIIINYPFFTRVTGIFGNQWFGVDPVAAGAFGVPAGFAASIIVSLLTRPNPPEIDQLVDYLRKP